MHWSDDFLGLDYDPEKFDCATLAIEAARVNGQNVSLPTYTLKTGKNGNAHELIAEFTEDIASPVNGPIDGQPVLMNTNGRVCHIGVCALINGAWYILHNVEKMGVIRQPLRAIEHEIEGFYQWLQPTTKKHL